ncbi:MAG: hypothetical protein QXZ48_00155 [Zestosphaera sp.]
MSKSILCEVCEERPAIRKCRICGRRVCEKHLSEDGVCAVCTDLMCRVCKARLSVTSCILCGRPICRTCSVELEPGIRMCIHCASNISAKEQGPESGLFGERVEQRHP